MTTLQVFCLLIGLSFRRLRQQTLDVTHYNAIFVAINLLAMIGPHCASAEWCPSATETLGCVATLLTADNNCPSALQTTGSSRPASLVTTDCNCQIKLIGCERQILGHTGCSSTVDLMLGQRLRRWPSIKSTLGQRPALARYSVT